MESSGCGIESSSAGHAVVSSAALSSTSTADAERQHWLHYTRRCPSLVKLHFVSHVVQNRLFNTVYEAGCHLTTSAACVVFEVCSRLDSPHAELESVYRRHLPVAIAEEKLFLNYLRCCLRISPIKIPAMLQGIVSDMAQASPPIPPFVKLFNVALSSCTLAHEAAQVKSVQAAVPARPSLCQTAALIFGLDYATHRRPWVDA